jgi:hypothetical protein
MCFLRGTDKPIDLINNSFCFKHLHDTPCFNQKTGRWIMSRTVIVILIYHRHKAVYVYENCPFLLSELKQNLNGVINLILCVYFLKMLAAILELFHTYKQTGGRTDGQSDFLRRPTRICERSISV